VITTGYVNEAPQTVIELVEGARRHCLGEALSAEEQQWLAARINEHLQVSRISRLQLISLFTVGSMHVFTSCLGLSGIVFTKIETPASL
jgi:hypothetical protein